MNVPRGLDSQFSQLDTVFQHAIDFEKDGWLPSLAAIEASWSDAPLQRYQWRYQLEDSLFDARLDAGGFATKLSARTVSKQGMDIHIAHNICHNAGDEQLHVVDDSAAFKTQVHFGHDGWVLLDSSMVIHHLGDMHSTITKWLEATSNLEMYCLYHKQRVAVCYKNSVSDIQVHVMFEHSAPCSSVIVEDGLWQPRQ
jgi:hypothetical protein